MLQIRLRTGELWYGEGEDEKRQRTQGPQRHHRERHFLDCPEKEFYPPALRGVQEDLRVCFLSFFLYKRI